MSCSRETHQHDESQEEPGFARGLLRMIAFLLVVDVIALIFGIAFFLIVHGMAIGMIRQVHHWQPARSFYERIVGFHIKSPTSSGIHSIIHSVTMMALSAAFVGLGIFILLESGFWEQNLIWHLCH